MNKQLLRRILMFATGAVSAAGLLSGMIPPTAAALLAFAAGVLKEVPKLFGEGDAP